MSVIEPCIPPATLISFIIDHCAHPTTLVVGSTSDQFIQQWHDDRDDDDDQRGISRDKTTLLEVAVARHIRVVFVPTVAHLRGFLAAFDPAASRIPAPPTLDTTSRRKHEKENKNNNKKKSKLIVYSLLRLHRDTSEWSAQGLGTTAAVLDEAGWRTGMEVVVAEGRSSGEDGQQGENANVAAWSGRVPVLSTSARRQLEKAGYAPRTERIRSVMERWFTFKAELVDEEEADTEAGAEADAEADAEAESRLKEDKEKKTTEAAAETPAPESPPRTFVKDSEDDDDDSVSDDY